jgi:hypothetical protein
MGESARATGAVLHTRYLFPKLELEAVMPVFMAAVGSYYCAHCPSSTTSKILQVMTMVCPSEDDYYFGQHIHLQFFLQKSVSEAGSGCPLNQNS